MWSSIYYFQKEKSDVIMKIIVNNIRDSGCVAIKFSQWILPKLESMYDINTKDEKYKWFKDLEELYEDCNYHEISHTKLDKPIIINEAIKLAKKFGQNSSHKFINAILDKVIKKS